MTDNEIIQAVGKLDGVKRWAFGLAYYTDNVDEDGQKPKPYLTSRDAIVPVIEKQDETIQRDVGDALPQDAGLEYLASPRQLCIALLKATGKWNDPDQR